MTTIGEVLEQGLRQNLQLGGVTLTSSQGDTFKALVNTAPELSDPVDNPRTRTPLHVKVMTLASNVTGAASGVTSFTDESDKTYTVLRYDETEQGVIMGFAQSWICEKART